MNSLALQTKALHRQPMLPPGLSPKQDMLRKVKAKPSALSKQPIRRFFPKLCQQRHGSRNPTPAKALPPLYNIKIITSQHLAGVYLVCSMPAKSARVACTRQSHLEILVHPPERIEPLWMGFNVTHSTVLVPHLLALQSLTGNEDVSKMGAHFISHHDAYS